jgi:hypothetical protein
MLGVSIKDNWTLACSVAISWFNAVRNFAPSSFTGVATRSAWLTGKKFQALAFQAENDPTPAKTTTAAMIAAETNLRIWCITPFLMLEKS